MKTRRPQGTVEWGYRLRGREYFVFVGNRAEAMAQARSDAWREDDFEICQGRLTWREDERADGIECNEDDEWFICIGTPERITIKPKSDDSDPLRESFDM